MAEGGRLLVRSLLTTKRLRTGARYRGEAPRTRFRIRFLCYHGWSVDSAAPANSPPMAKVAPAAIATRAEVFKKSRRVG